MDPLLQLIDELHWPAALQGLQFTKLRNVIGTMLARKGVAFQGRGFESHRDDSTPLFNSQLFAVARQFQVTFFLRPRAHGIPYGSMDTHHLVHYKKGAKVLIVRRILTENMYHELFDDLYLTI